MPHYLSDHPFEPQEICISCSQVSSFLGLGTTIASVHWNIKIHTETRSKKLIGQLYSLGLNIGLIGFFNWKASWQQLSVRTLERKGLWFLLSYCMGSSLWEHLTTWTTTLQAQQLWAHSMVQVSASFNSPRHSIWEIIRMTSDCLLMPAKITRLCQLLP